MERARERSRRRVHRPLRRQTAARNHLAHPAARIGATIWQHRVGSAPGAAFWDYCTRAEQTDVAQKSLRATARILAVVRSLSRFLASGTRVYYLPLDSLSVTSAIAERTVASAHHASNM